MYPNDTRMLLIRPLHNLLIIDENKNILRQWNTPVFGPVAIFSSVHVDVR